MRGSSALGPDQQAKGKSGDDHSDHVDTIPCQERGLDVFRSVVVICGYELPRAVAHGSENPYPAREESKDQAEVSTIKQCVWWEPCDPEDRCYQG